MFRIGILCFFVLLMCSCNNSDSSADYDASLPSAPVVPAPELVSFKVVDVYPHDVTSFTQGLELYGGKLFEGTGEYTKSKLRIVDLKTGVAEKSHTIGDPSIFGEGITILNDKIYQLTWQNNKIFEYSIDDITRPVRTYNWPREGWGATNNGNQLIISDGTSQLYFVRPDEASGEMQVEKTLTVRSHIGVVNHLNELELIEGKIYANRWLTNEILIIDTTTGYVKGVMNFTGLLQKYAPAAVLGEGSVLNGIAYDSATKRLYITGKEWPKLFEIEVANP